MSLDIVSNDQSSPELEPIPAAYLVQVKARERTWNFVVPNPTEDFFDKLIQNIGQTRLNLEMTLTQEEVKKIMGETGNYWVSSWPESPFQWLCHIYWYASDEDKKIHMEQFIKGYIQLIQDAIAQYRKNIPVDIVADPRIQSELVELNSIIRRMEYTNKPINMWKDPYAYFTWKHYIR